MIRGLGLLDDAPDVLGTDSLEELLGASVSGDPCIDRTPLLQGEVMLDQGQTGSPSAVLQPGVQGDRAGDAR